MGVYLWTHDVINEQKALMQRHDEMTIVGEGGEVEISCLNITTGECHAFAINGEEWSEWKGLGVD